MRLPDIEYTAALPSPVQSAGAPFEAGVKLTKVVQEGLTALGQEMLKTEQMKAAATLQERLNDATLEIQAKPVVSAQELRDLFGGEIPSHIQPYMTVQKVDPVTGKVTEQDNDQIPMFLAGGSIFDAKAKEALLQASSQIAMPGWQAEFQDRAQGHIQERRMRLAEQQLQAMHQFQNIAQKDAIGRLTSTGDFRGANLAIAQSQVLSPAEKVQEWHRVRSAEQTQPVIDADASNNPELIQAQITRLRNPKSPDVDALSPAERNQLATHLEGKLKSLEAVADKHKAERATALSAGVMFDLEAQFLAGRPIGLPLNDPRMAALRADPGDAHAAQGLQRVAEKVAFLQNQQRARARESKSDAAEARRARNEATQIALRDLEVRPEAEIAQESAETLAAAYPTFDPDQRNVLLQRVKKAQGKVAQDGGLGSDQRKALILNEVASLDYSEKTKKSFLVHVEARLDREFTKDKPPTQEDVLRIVADEVLTGRTKNPWIDDNEERWRAEDKGAQSRWTPAPVEKQEGEVRKRGAAALGAPAAPAKATTPKGGIPKAGDTVDGSQVGKPAGTKWEILEGGKMKRVQ